MPRRVAHPGGLNVRQGLASIKINLPEQIARLIQDDDQIGCLNDLERIRRGDAERNSDRKTAGAWEVFTKRSAPLLIKVSSPGLHNHLLRSPVGSQVQNKFRDRTRFRSRPRNLEGNTPDA